MLISILPQISQFIQFSHCSINPSIKIIFSINTFPRHYKLFHNYWNSEFPHKTLTSNSFTIRSQTFTFYSILSIKSEYKQFKALIPCQIIIYFQHIFIETFNFFHRIKHKWIQQVDLVVKVIKIQKFQEIVKNWTYL